MVRAPTARFVVLVLVAAAFGVGLRGTSTHLGLGDEKQQGDLESPAALNEAHAKLARFLRSDSSGATGSADMNGGKRADDDDNHDDDDDDDDDCSASGLKHAEDQCAYAKDCDDDIAFLIPYLEIFYCTSSAWKPLLGLGFVLWLMVMISLLGTTADYQFVPSLEFLSFDVLHLSPEVAGITLLALGNGAPDVFSALAGINKQSDFKIVLGALIGASVFISTLVLGCVLLVSTCEPQVERAGFQRDLVAYFVTVVAIVVIAHDGNVYIYEALSLLCIYFAYVAVVVSSASRSPRQGGATSNSNARGSNLRNSKSNDRYRTLLPGNTSGSHEPLTTPGLGPGSGTMTDERTSSAEDLPVIAGFEWPAFAARESNADNRSYLLSDALTIFYRAQVVAEWPFSVMRWLTCPCVDRAWDSKRRFIAVVAPIGFVNLVLLDA